MEKTEIRAVEMTRRIRARHAEQLRGATAEERIRFYRDKAKRLNLDTSVSVSQPGTEDTSSRGS